MKEQSHKSEMGAALRGDFERLRARRSGGEVVLRRPAVAVVERSGLEEPVLEAPVLAEPAPDPPAPEPQRHSWRARLLGRC